MMQSEQRGMLLLHPIVTIKHKLAGVGVDDDKQEEEKELDDKVKAREKAAKERVKERKKK